MDDVKLTLFVTDGPVFEYNAYRSIIRYTDLSREAALDIAERSLSEGYTVAAYIQCDDAETEEDAECGR